MHIVTTYTILLFACFSAIPKYHWIVFRCWYAVELRSFTADLLHSLDPLLYYTANYFSLNATLNFLLHSKLVLSYLCNFSKLFLSIILFFDMFSWCGVMHCWLYFVFHTLWLIKMWKAIFKSDQRSLPLYLFLHLCDGSLINSQSRLPSSICSSISCPKL